MNAIGISLFWEDGTPDGIRTAAVLGWAASAIACPRKRIESILERPELSSPGVYLLSGTEQGKPGICVYVGQSGDIAERIRSHQWNYENKSAKTFWDQTFLITSNDGFFTKAHALFVESELIRLVSQANRARLWSRIQPKPPKLPPGGKVLAQRFLRFIEIVLPAMGLNILSPRPSTNGNGSRNDLPSRPKRAKLTPLVKKRLAFWHALLKMQRGNSDLFQHTIPSKEGWIAKYRHGCSWAIVALKNSSRAELFINTTDVVHNKALFDALAAERSAIEKDFGGSLKWQRLDDKKASRISSSFEAGLDDVAKWPDTIDRALDVMNRLYKALEPRVIAYKEAQRN